MTFLADSLSLVIYAAFILKQKVFKIVSVNRKRSRSIYQIVSFILNKDLNRMIHFCAASFIGKDVLS